MSHTYRNITTRMPWLVVREGRIVGYAWSRQAAEDASRYAERGIRGGHAAPNPITFSVDLAGAVPSPQGALF